MAENVENIDNLLAVKNLQKFFTIQMLSSFCSNKRRGCFPKPITLAEVGSPLSSLRLEFIGMEPSGLQRSLRRGMPSHIKIRSTFKLNWYFSLKKKGKFTTQLRIYCFL